MIRFAICEDEPLLAEGLEEQVHRYMTENGLAGTVAVFPAGEPLLLGGGAYDIVLMDIGLAGGSGVDVARRMRQGGSPAVFIFVTSHRQYTLDAFDLGAVHYLVKPVAEEKLFEALGRALRRAEGEDNGGLLLSKGGTRRTLRFRDILCAEVLNHQVFLHLAGEEIGYYGKMDELEEGLDGRFFRCHRSYIVNLDAVHSLDAASARLTDGTVVPVSRRKQPALSAALLDRFRKGAT